jgi:hypothetical protein
LSTSLLPPLSPLCSSPSWSRSSSLSLNKRHYHRSHLWTRPLATRPITRVLILAFNISSTPRIGL